MTTLDVDSSVMLPMAESTRAAGIDPRGLGSGRDVVRSKAARDDVRGSSSPPASAAEDRLLRQRVGEFVGDVFYGTLIRQMQASKLKGEYFHGGRGEEVFQAQLGMELAQRMGRAIDDPIANRIYEAMSRRLGRQQTWDGTAAPREDVETVCHEVSHES
ncbi:MAG: hypothetical protein JXQ75_05495 [Phycisphaerae bacterium]|nr:hypothetical protein [Phycisphaerae bacterium]